MSKIEWTERTWNPIVGCSIVSPGCTNCYAMRMASRLALMSSAGARYIGTTTVTKAGAVWTGVTAVAPEATFRSPLRRRKPTTYFVNSMSDLFHETVADDVIDRVFAVMALCPQHRFQVLTKRSRRMKDYMSRACGRIADRIMELRRKIGMPPSSVAPLPHVRPGAAWWPLANVWLGVSVEDQPRADERIADLFATDAVVRWLSCEPLLSDIQFDPCELISLDWIVAGGESGPGARPMHPDWARSIRDQCEAVGVPFFFKQWGDWEVALDRERDDPDWRADYTNVYVDRGKSKWLNLQGGCGFHGERFHVMRRVGKRAAGRLLDGVQHDGMPS